MLAGALAPPQGGDALEEVVHQNVRLERAAGFRRHDHQRLAQIERRFGRRNLRRIGAVEHVKLRPSRLAPECLGENFRREARAAHAEEQRVGIALPLHMCGKIFELGDAVKLGVDDAQPAEPLVFVGARPQRRVARPESADAAVLAPSLELFFVAFLRFAGIHAEGEAGLRAIEQPQSPLRHGGEQLVEGVGKEPDAVLRELRRDIVEAYAIVGERGEVGTRSRQVALNRVSRNDAMVAEGVERRGRHGVDRIPSNQLFDIDRVLIGGILCARRSPEQALDLCSGARELEPARRGDERLEQLVGELGVGDRNLALEPRCAFLLRTPQQLVHGRVDATDEEARDACDFRHVAARFEPIFKAEHIGVGDLLIDVDREQQRDIDVDPLRDERADRRQTGFRRGDLDHQIGARDDAPKMDRLPYRGLGVVCEIGRAFEADVTILPLRVIVDGTQRVRRVADVLERQLLVNFRDAMIAL